MKLLVSSYNVGDSWNKEEEELDSNAIETLRSYTLDHTFLKPAKCVITLADPDGTLLRKYKTETAIDLAGGVADDGGAETDETTETNSAAANDMTLLPAVPQVNDAYYFGFDEEVGAFTLNVGNAGVGNWTITWEYSQGTDAWAALGGVTDDTTGFTVLGENNVEWTIPGDWATDDVGGVTGKYWVRGRVSAFVAINAQPLGTQAWYNKVWIGPGKITLENPNATDNFYGRIVNVHGTSTHPRMLTLECKDWLDQLDEEIITYDMREKLGTTDLRQSKLRSDVDDGRVAVENDGGTFYAYDDGDYCVNGGMGFVNDSYNGYFLVLTVGMAGKKTWRFYAYDSTASGGTVYDDNPELTWCNQGSVDTCSDNADFTLDYVFHVELGHNTPSDFYVHGSITGARVFVRYQLAVVAANHAHVQIDDKTDGWIEFATLEEDDHFIDVEYELENGQYTDIVDANGIATVRFDVDRTGGDAAIAISFLYLEVDTTTTGYSTPILINDTINPNKLEVATDLTAAATQLWEGVDYCISKYRYLHFESATGIILGGDNIVTLTCGAANVENTTGVSTRQHKNRTRLQIARDEATDDGAVFWMALGGTPVTYKKTFGASTETMTDATPDSWQSLRDYNITNDYDVYGARLGDYEIFQQSQDTTSIATYNATRSKVTKNAGLVSDADAAAIGTTLAARDANIQQMIACTLSGFDTTYRLGTIVEITSSYLWATAAKDYIVTRWAYDSDAHKTHLTLHPKVSIGLQEIDTPIAEGERLKMATKKSETDKFVPDPITHEVS